MQNNTIADRIKDVARRLVDGPRPAVSVASPAGAPSEPPASETNPPLYRLSVDSFKVTTVAGEDELIDVRLAVFAYAQADDPGHQPPERLLGVYEERNLYVEREGKARRPMPPIFEGMVFDFDRKLEAIRFVVNVQSVETGVDTTFHGQGFTSWRVREILRELHNLPVGAHTLRLTRNDTTNGHETFPHDGNFELVITVERFAPAATAA